MAAPLALEFTAHGQASGWRSHEDLIDALPYIDPLDPSVKRQVDALIDEEMKKSTKKPADYLKELPPLPSSRLDSDPVLKAEYERVKSKTPMPPLDVTRYRLDPPLQSKRQDPAAWKTAVDNAHSQLEHQYLRIMNLELMLKYGDKAWRAQCLSEEALVKRLQEEVADTKRKITQLNMERKLQQTAAGSELRKAEEEYMDLVRKNFAIEEACRALEDQAHKLREQLGVGAAGAAAAQQQEGSGGAAVGEENGHAAGADGMEA